MTSPEQMSLTFALPTGKEGVMGKDITRTNILGIRVAYMQWEMTTPDFIFL